LMAYMYHITPNPRKTVLSQVAEHVFGRTFPYYYIQSTTALILILAANTAFSGFPLLASIMAKDKFMPRMFNNRGDRLNFSNGIILLAFAAIALIVLFNGDIDRLIPLYAIGVFLSFTLAQSGLVYRWWRKRSTRWISKLAVNALGAVVTLIVLLIFAITKFDEGAWIVIIVIPIMIFLFYQIRRHYNAVAEQLRVNIKEVKPTDRVQKEHLIIVPVGGINQVVVNTLSYAKKLNGEIVALYVAFDEEEVKKMESRWKEWNPGVRLVVTRSRFRSVIHPLMRLIHKVEAKERQVTVLIPEFIPLKWWHRLLHNQTALMLRFVLLIRTRVVIATVPFHLHK
ncbi:MAG: amino acid permease, partial [Thermoactinomyces sp.]